MGRNKDLQRVTSAGLPVYYRWDLVPGGMYTATRLKTEGYYLRPDQKPVGLKRHSFFKSDTPLYTKEEATRQKPKAVRKPKMVIPAWNQLHLFDSPAVYREKLIEFISKNFKK